MPLRLTRLQISDRIIESSGTPGQQFLRFFNRALQNIEDAVNGLAQAVADIIVAQAAADSAATDAAAAQADATQAIADAAAAQSTADSKVEEAPVDGTKYVRKDAGWVSESAGGAAYEAGSPTPPTTADLATWLNQGTSTVSDGTGAMILKPQPNTQYRSRVKAVPSTPYSVYCRVDLHSLSTAANTSSITIAGGIVLRDSADSEIVAFFAAWDRVSGDEQNTYSVGIGRWTSDGTTNSSTPVSKLTGQLWHWLRVDDDGTTFTFYASMDGKNWHQVGTETRAAFIDAVTHYGVTAVATANATEAIVQFSYFSTTAPA